MPFDLGGGAPRSPHTSEKSLHAKLHLHDFRGARRCLTECGAECKLGLEGFAVIRTNFDIVINYQVSGAAWRLADRCNDSVANSS